MTTSTSWTVAGLLIAMLGPMVIAIVSVRFATHANRLGSAMLSQAAMVGVVGAVLAIVLFREHRLLSSIGFASVGPWSAAWGLALAVFFMYVFAPAAYWALRRLHLVGFEAGLAKLQGIPAGYLVAGVLIGGTAEEILYRGYAFERIAEMTGSLWLAGAVPLLIYAFAHVPMWGPGPALTTVVSGAILTAFYAWHRDVVANIVAHVVTDLAGIVVGPLLASRRAK